MTDHTITLTISDATYARAKRIAQNAAQSVESVLATRLEETLDDLAQLTTDEQIIRRGDMLTRESLSTPTPIENPAREAIRARLDTAGVLSKIHYAPTDAVVPSNEEMDRIRRVFSVGRSSDEIIDEERGAY